MLQKFSVFLLFSLLLLLLPANAAALINAISQGNTVFIGEQGLDIRSAVGTDTQIGWWGSGAAIATSAPDQTVVISSPESFFVTPSAFTAYTGNWYRLSGTGQVDGIAFNVADPYLAIRVEDTTINLDRTNDWLPKGDLARFAIDSNLDSVYNQRGAGAPVTIYVQSPDGGQYSSLYGPGGITHSIVNIPITTNPFYTDSIWDTGNSAYAQGTYVVWVECNLNHMKDNYDVTGKTVSNQVTVLDQDVNPLISANVPTTNPMTSIATTIATTRPVTSVATTVRTTQPVTSTTTTVPATLSGTTTIIGTIQSTPVTSPSQSSGFEFTFALLAIIVSIGLCLMKE